MPSNTFAAQATDPQGAAAGMEAAPKVEQQPDQGVALIVGERAFATMEDVKTKITNADSHITNIESENATLRAQLDEVNERLAEAQSVEDVLNIKEDNKGTGLTEDQIKLLVSDNVANINVQTVEQGNLKGCLDKAEAMYGEGFIGNMTTMAKDVGLSMDEVDEMAKKNPRLFEKTFLPTNTRVTVPTSHVSTIRTSGFQEAPATGTKPVMSLTAKQRTQQFLSQLEALQT